MMRITVKQKIGLILFGVVTCLILLEGGLRLGGFILTLHQRYRNWVAVSKEGDYTILCLGESTTQDEWPFNLVSILNESDMGITFTVIDKGRGGIDTAVIVSKLERYLDQYDPDMIITMMGINDGEATVKYDDSLDRKIILLLQDVRVYKLTKLLWEHIEDKIKNRQRVYAFSDQKSNVNASPINGDEEESTLSTTSVTNEPVINYYGEGESYMYREEYDKAQRMFEKAIAIDPHNENIYLNLATCYVHQENWDKAEDMFNQLIEINPKNLNVYCDLSYLHREMGEYEKAIKTLERALEINPLNEMARHDLGLLFKLGGKYERGIEMFEEAFTVHAVPSQDEVAHFELGWFYLQNREYDKAEHHFIKVLEVNSKRYEAYSFLSHIYEEKGEQESANKYRELSKKCLYEIQKSHLDYYNEKTQYNYRRLMDIVTTHDKQLVCVQYPMRNLAQLKDMLTPYNNVIFVDNERIFKNALQEARHSDYFKDMFAGDFGHCTDKGNQLLAKNISRVVLKEVFGKELVMK